MNGKLVLNLIKSAVRNQIRELEDNMNDAYVSKNYNFRFDSIKKTISSYREVFQIVEGKHPELDLWVKVKKS